MTAQSDGMVDQAQYMKGTLDSGQNTRWTRHFSNIFSYDESASDKREKNNDVYGPTPDIAETSPRGHPDVRRGCPNPPHAREARRNPNYSAEAKR